MAYGLLAISKKSLYLSGINLDTYPVCTWAFAIRMWVFWDLPTIWTSHHHSASLNPTITDAQETCTYTGYGRVWYVGLSMRVPKLHFISLAPFVLLRAYPLSRKQWSNTLKTCFLSHRSSARPRPRCNVSIIWPLIGHI